MHRNCFLQQNFFSPFLDWCLWCHIIQNFFKNVSQKEFCPFFCFLLWTIPICVHLDPRTLNFDQFYMTSNHLPISKNSSTASIELWLVSNSSYRHDRIKEKKNCTFFKILTGKKFNIVCRKKVFLVFKNVQNLFLTPKFLLSFFRPMSLVSHHAAFLKRLFTRRILPFFSFLWWTIPNCVHLDPCTLNFDQFYMTWNPFTKSKNTSTASIEWW